MTRPRHSVSVAAAIINPEGQALVIQRRDNYAWQLPGGILEHDETIQDGLAREVFEEIGVTVRPDRLTGAYKNMNLGVVALVFRATLVAGSPVPTEESAVVEWWAPKQIRQRMDEAFAVRILDAIQPGPVPAIRAHDGTRLLDAP
jgi:8-oxo-dGTP diphosphatase